MTDHRLTQYARGGGCSCKIPPGELEAVLATFPSFGGGSEVLVGLEHGDDAAVVRIDGDRAVVSTVDFFAPVVDDPYDFGRIAAANALSDVYAVEQGPVPGRSNDDTRRKRGAVRASRLAFPSR
jgi:selenide,water dikinase